MATFLLLMGISVFAWAQNQISGKIADNQGKALPGVNITVKGGTTGTVTDVNGNYTITINDPNDILVFSYVGFESQEVAVGNQSNITVTLEEESKQIAEVKVTAFGIKKDTRNIGYSVQEISGEDMKKVRDPNAINSLTGKIAGLTIAPSAEMLASPKMILRGSSDVLIIVDGVPVNSDSYNINADDVETYTVLKGPNAAALYGFRGQNGAIIITTKKGLADDKKGTKIEFNSSNLFDVGFNSILNTQKEYGIGENYTYAFGDLPTDGGKFTRANVWGPRLEGQPIAQWNSPINQVTGKRDSTPFVSYKNNFHKYLETGFFSTNNISITSSQDRFNSRISAGHAYQKSMLPNAGLNVSNVNIYTGYKITSKLDIEASLNYNRQYSPNVPDIYYGPNSAVYMFGVYGSSHWDIDDMHDYWMPGQEGIQQQFAEYGRANNPYFMAYEWTREHFKNDMYGYAKLNYKVNDDMNVSLRTQASTWDMLRTEKVPFSANKYGRETEKKGDYNEDRRNSFENNNDLLLTYNKNITPSIYLSALAGASSREFTYNSIYQTTDFLVVPGVYNFSNSLYPVRSYNYKANMMVYSGYYGFDLSYLNYVTLSSTGRWDKLSTLPKDNNLFFYPSATISTMISDYIKMPKAISSIKLRASFANVKGALTKASIGPAYQAMGFGDPFGSSLRSHIQTTYNGPTYLNQNSYIVRNLYNNEPSATITSTMANSSLDPYSVTSYEGGLESNFFNNRFGIDVTYFIMSNGPQIFSKTASPSSGYMYELINGVVTEKNGFEISTRIVPVFKRNGLKWLVALNAATYKETLKEVRDGEEGISINGHYYEIGDRLDAIYGTMYNRDQQGSIIYDAGGMPLYSPKGDENKKLLGYANPDLVWGISNTLLYKNFTFSFQIDGRLGGKMFNELAARQFQSGNSPVLVEGAYGEARLHEWESYRDNGSIDPGYIGEGVTIVSGTPVFENGYITNWDELTFAKNEKAVRIQSYTQSVYSNVQEEFMVDKSYAKLRELSFGYTFPAKIFGSKIQQLTVSLVGRNLLYFSKVNNMDMDQYAEGFNAANNDLRVRPSDARLQSPTTRQIGFNINLTF